MDELTKAQRFLNAFNRIEYALRSRAKLDFVESTFTRLVKNSRELIPAQVNGLLDMATLRNAIVHTPYDEGNEIYADPRTSSVEWLEKQADIIERPPLVCLALKLKPPLMLSISDEVDKFFGEISEPNNFSQSPFRRNDGSYGLITTNSVARWVAANYERNNGILAEPTLIGAVALFAEFEDRLEVRSKNLKAVDAIRIFSGQGGVPPAAILMTEKIGTEERPVGLCVRANLPELYNAIGV